MEKSRQLDEILNSIPREESSVAYTALTRAFNAYNDILQYLHKRYRLLFFIQSLETISMDIDIMNDDTRPGTLKTDKYHRARTTLIRDVNALLNTPSSI
jgi:hypothetical protein